MNHSRISTYEILYQFICQSADEKKLPLFRELLTYDLYLRENIKNRPSFSGEYTVNKEELFHLYDNVFPKDPDLSAYANKNLRKMSHIEKFQFDVAGDRSRKETLLLFDYQKRDPLNHQAYVVRIWR